MWYSQRVLYRLCCPGPWLELPPDSVWTGRDTLERWDLQKVETGPWHNYIRKYLKYFNTAKVSFFCKTVKHQHPHRKVIFVRVNYEFSLKKNVLQSETPVLNKISHHFYLHGITQLFSKHICLCIIPQWKFILSSSRYIYIIRRYSRIEYLT